MMLCLYDGVRGRRRKFSDNVVKQEKLKVPTRGGAGALGTPTRLYVQVLRCRQRVHLRRANTKGGGGVSLLEECSHVRKKMVPVCGGPGAPAPPTRPTVPVL